LTDAGSWPIFLAESYRLPTRPRTLAFAMNPERWTFRWLLIVPFLVGALISHRWKMMLPAERSARIPTSTVRYMSTEKASIKLARFLDPEVRPPADLLLAKATCPGVEELLELVAVSDKDPLYRLMSLQL
jgi:hypothetical protein